MELPLAWVRLTSDTTPAFNLQDATDYKTSNLSGTISNSQLDNSWIKIGDSKRYLGSTYTTPTINLVDCYGYPSSLVTSIGNSQLSNSSITINTTSPLTGGTTLSLGSSMTLDLDEILKSKISSTGEWDLTEIPTITNSKLQNSSVTFTAQTPLKMIKCYAKSIY